VLYKGHIPNYVYNVPNKVYEYLSCGLHVIVGAKLITTVKLGLPQIKIVDFYSLDLLSIKNHISLIQIQEPDYSCQSKLVHSISK
jgi:hypothetical protein